MRGDGEGFRERCSFLGVRPSPDEIVGAAQRWLRTPYQHRASVKGVGCDCLGLIRGVWREVLGAEPTEVPPYAGDWAEAGEGEPLADAMDRWFEPTAA